METFNAKDFLPAPVLAQVTDIRVSDPERSWRITQERKRRPQLTLNGKLNILAADHPARRVTRVAGDPLRMADRHDYLARTLRVLLSDMVDGVLATMDILEDLLIIHDLMRKADLHIGVRKNHRRGRRGRGGKYSINSCFPLRSSASPAVNSIWPALRRRLVSASSSPKVLFYP